jgi:GNAT superfamily N-acetyltransferase
MDAAPRLIRADLEDAGHRAVILAMTRDYFQWMNGEIQRAIGLTIREIVGMDQEVYLTHMLDTLCAGRSPDTVFLLVECDGESAGMGGIRPLEDGAAEIVRIYTRPSFRGRGIGALLVGSLVEEARRLGHRTIRLDTGLFMTSAQRIYRAAGFQPIGPYAGAEPPEVLQPIWLYMEKML